MSSTPERPRSERPRTHSPNRITRRDFPLFNPFKSWIWINFRGSGKIYGAAHNRMFARRDLCLIETEPDVHFWVIRRGSARCGKIAIGEFRKRDADRGERRKALATSNKKNE
ncbi:hypothetical protein EVAR_891_1 [Eumeta japonica]|uniref:Uncharacterized protein n=1 Tax=Eumeta variegata TaxID=151549 RepID=A0A4C1SDP0_EUMVA|nr:hypothetical protein EVAR_891_1 [Eumeta japonica]